MHRSYSLSSRIFYNIAFTVALLITLNNNLYSQGSANVSVTGIPGVINTPFTDEFFDNFSNGRYQVIFNYNNPNPAPQEFSFRFTFVHNGKKLLEIESRPEAFEPGVHMFASVFEDLSFDERLDDILDQLDRRLLNQVVQGGTLPEGNYQLKIDPIAHDNPSLAAAPFFVNFVVIYPEAPILINPPNKAILAMETPIFNWTAVPISGYAIEYEFLLVEVFENQTPLQAINSNRAHAEQILPGQNTLIYTPEFLPLEDGKEYAWRVKASSPSQDLPIKNDGESELKTFHYKSDGGPLSDLDIEELENIPIIPNFAQLINLEDLEVSEQGSMYVLDGVADLQLDFNGQESQFVTVNIHNLQIQKQNLSNPIVQGGSINGQATNIKPYSESTEELVVLNQIEWQFGGDMNATATIQNINGKDYSTSGKLILEPQGLRGAVKATGVPLFAFEHELVELEITELEASYPEQTLTGEGEIKYFGETTSCEMKQFAFVDGEFTTAINCDDELDLPLSPNSDLLTMNVRNVMGTISADVNSNTLNYGLTLNTSIGLLTEQNKTCGVDALVNLDSTSGLEIIPGQQRCEMSEPKIDLGFLKLELTKTELNNLTYNAVAKNWDFELELSAKLNASAFDEWSSIELDNIIVNPNGIHFNQIAFENTIGELPDYYINDFRVQLQSFILNQFTFPLFDWDGRGPGPWDLSFSGDVFVPDNDGYPACVSGLQLALNGGSVDGMEVLASINPINFDECRYHFGADYGIDINNLSGQFGVRYKEEGGFEPVGQLDFGGNLVMGKPFICEENEITSVGESRFSFKRGLVGTIENVIPTCEMPLGPFTVQVTNSELNFNHALGNAPQADMQAEAKLTLPGGQAVEGAFNLDMMTGDLTSVLFELNDPFNWGIPHKDPALTFHLNKARLDENGFFVDGRHQLLLESGNQIGATFDNLLIDLENPSIKNGSIIFDEAFGLTAGINPLDYSLNFKAVQFDAALDQDPGLYMGLAGQIVIDKNGLHVNGESGAAIAFNGKTFGEQTEVTFSDDFSLSLFPFGVASGRADFLYENRRFAYIEPDGFHPIPGFFGDMLIPDRLALPSEEIAYITLRDENDELLVEVNENNEGNYELSTKPGKVLSLVAPILDATNPPILSNVELNDVVISGDLYNPGIISGNVEVEVPTDNPALQLTDRNVPLTIRKLHFGTRTVDGEQLLALFMLGDLNLFEQTLSTSTQQAEFYVQSDGVIYSKLDLADLDADVSIVDNDQVILTLESIGGYFALGRGSSSPNYDFNMAGKLNINSEAGLRGAADLNLRIAPGIFDINFDTDQIDLDTELDFGLFGLELDKITAIPEFDYSAGSGFEFAIAFDAGLRISPSGGNSFSFPLQGVELRHNGIILPPQLINKSSIPGLNIPEFSLVGFDFKPLKLELDSQFFFNWSESNITFNPDIRMDFTLDLPTFEGTGLNPPDGLTFNGVGFENGFLVGNVEPFSPLGGVSVPLIPGLNDSPMLNISKLYGGLSYSPEDGQLVNINIDGELGNLPMFTIDDASSCINPDFTLSLVDQKHFVGNLQNLQPCGYLELGPAKLSINSADLNFSVSDSEQKAELLGEVEVELPAPNSGTVTAVGNDVTIDLITGKITNGYIDINSAFALKLPYKEPDPLFNFTVNEARLDKDGFMIDGFGKLVNENIDADVTFNSFQIDFSPFTIASGSASLASEVGLAIGVSPLSLHLKDNQTPLTLENGIDLSLAGSLELNPEGLALSGEATADILFNGESYSSLRVDLQDSFTLGVNGFSVQKGSAKFYEGIDAEAELLAILDENGFDPVGLMSLLPSRIPLPTEEVAYVDIKDQNDNLLVDVTTNQDGGYTLATKSGNNLKVVLAGLDNAEVDVEFSLSTDGNYNITGGSLALSSPTSLESQLNLPIKLTKLEISDLEGLNLLANLEVDLPGPLSEGNSQAIIETAITPDGFEGSVEIGSYTTVYQSNLEPLYEYIYSGNISGSNETDAFSASLLGVKVNFGTTNNIALSGTLSSSLIIDEESGEEPFFYTASFGNEGWSFNIDHGDGIHKLGQASLEIAQHDGIQIKSENNSFHVILNGTVSLGDLLGEPLDISVQDLELGVNNYNTNPSLHFDITEATGAFADQAFTLFEGALKGTIRNPSIVVNGRAIGIQSTSGELTFLDQDIDYTNLKFDTDGGFDFDEISTSDIELLGEYLRLNSLALVNSENGLRVESDLAVSLPEPVGKSANAMLKIYRDNTGKVQFDASDPEFEINEEFALGDFGHFKLTKAGAHINPNEWENTRIFANGQIYKEGKTEAIINFGDDANMAANPGISVGLSPYLIPEVGFNATGNASFSFDFSIFTINTELSGIASSHDEFEITINGNAGIGIDGFSGSMGYEGFTISTEGVKDYGNLSGTGDIEIAGIASLTIGKFVYEKYEDGRTINIVDASVQDPNELESKAEGAAPTTTKTVTELLCFGPCPVEDVGGSSGTALRIDIGDAKNQNGEGIGGGVERIFFYRTTSGDMAMSVDGLALQLGDYLDVAASFDYENTNDGMLLRAVASGSFSAGGVSAAAAVAGKFANIDGKTSYGLFLGVQSSVGVPIIPGVITLTGIGGGFFYKPDQRDMNFVHQALDGLDSQLAERVNPPSANNVNFAAFLYAGVGLVGTGEYVVDGRTFIQLTNNSFSLDVYGNVLGLDGQNSIASTEVAGYLKLQVTTEPTLFILGNIGIKFSVPSTIEGSGEIEYFAKDTGNEVLWGIIGNAEYDVLNGILTGSGELLAGKTPDGMGILLDFKAGFDVPVPIISIKSSVEFSTWLIDNPNIALPFGAYIVFKGEACLVFCITAEAKGAFATKKPSGFVIYAAVKGCVDLWLTEGCLSAWAEVTNNGIDAGFGSSGHNDLISQAKQQRNSFQEALEDIKGEIDAAKEALSNPPPFPDISISTKEVAKAGENFYKQTAGNRSSIYESLLSTVETDLFGSTGYSVPSNFDGLVNNIMLAPRDYYNNIQSSSMFSPLTAKAEVEDKIQRAEYLSEQVGTLLGHGLRTSIEYLDEAQLSFDEMLSTMSESPVKNATLNYEIHEGVVEAPSFSVNQTEAQNQEQNIESLRESIQLMDQKYQESIASVDSILVEMNTLLSGSEDGNSGNTSHSVNELTEQYADVLSHIEKYYALEANWRWLDWAWAINLRNNLHQQQNQIQTGIQSLGNTFKNALANKDENSANFMNVISRIAQRKHTIKRFSDEDKIFGMVWIDELPQDIVSDRNLLANAADYELNTVMEMVNSINTSFWYDFHDFGLEGYFRSQSRKVIDEVIPAKDNLKNKLVSANKAVTDMIDSFYANKANLTAILYNMIDNYMTWKQHNEVDHEAITSSVNTSERFNRGRNINLNTINSQVTVAPNSFERRLDRLSDELVPPQITSITVTPNRPQNGSSDSYFNVTDITWNATHPVGIIENSIDINEYSTDTDVSSGYYDYLSIGGNNSFTTHSFKVDDASIRTGVASTGDDQIFRNTRDISVGVRVRGFAGNTAIRKANFRVDVGPEGVATSPNSNVLVADDTPPEQVAQYFSPYYDKNTFSQTIRTDGFERLDGSSAPSFSIPIEVSNYWTNDAQAIKLYVLGKDDQSGISTFEYAVGSQKGATDIVDWSELQGQRNYLAHSHQYEMRGQTTLLNMELDKTYYVSVRATNGAGVVSSVYENPTPIQYDSERPTKPGVQLSVAGAVYQGIFLATNVEVDADPLVETVSALYIHSDTASEWTNAEKPRIKASWAASNDDRSGVKEYEYVVSTESEAPMSEFEKNNVRTTTDTEATYIGGPNTPLKDYFTEVFVYVRAIDYAGNASEVLKLGPYTAADPTSPHMPVMEGTYGFIKGTEMTEPGLSLYFTELPYDPETDLKGVQYSLGTTAGATNLKPWPDNNTVDFEWNSTNNMALYESGYQASTTVYSDLRSFKLPVGELPKSTFYLNYRVVNNQGIVSGVRTIGPIVPKDGGDLITTNTKGTPQVSSPVLNTGIRMPASGVTGAIMANPNLGVPTDLRNNGGLLGGQAGLNQNKPQISTGNTTTEPPKTPQKNRNF